MSSQQGSLTGLMTAKVHATTILHFWLRAGCALDRPGIRVTRGTRAHRMRIIFVLHRCDRMCGSAQRWACEATVSQLEFFGPRHHPARWHHRVEIAINMLSRNTTNKCLAPGNTAWRTFDVSSVRPAQRFVPFDISGNRHSSQRPNSCSRTACDTCCNANNV